jgi:hypothetical protein
MFNHLKMLFMNERSFFSCLDAVLRCRKASNLSNSQSQKDRIATLAVFLTVFYSKRISNALSLFSLEQLEHLELLETAGTPGITGD